MPKGTVITVPAENVRAEPQAQPRQRPARKIVFPAVGGKIHGAVTALLHPVYWPVNIMAFLLARVSIMGEMSPFGLAFFAAVTQVSRSQAAAAGIWMIAGIVSMGSVAEAAIYSLTAVLFWRFSRQLNRMHRKLLAVPLFVFGSVLLGGFAASIWTNFTLYRMLLSVINALLCMVLTILFTYGAPLVVNPTRETARGERLVCLIVMLAIAIAGVGHWLVWGYSLRNIAAGLLIMAMAAYGGAGIGAAVGVVVGLVVGLSDGNASQIIALYSISGLLAGSFYRLGRQAVVLGFAIGIIIALLYFVKSRELPLFLTEAAVSAGLLFMVPASALKVWPADWSNADSSVLKQHVNTAMEKISNMARMFNDLADTFSHISHNDQNKCREKELARFLAAVGERVCGDCSLRSHCWEKNFYQTYQAVIDLIVLTESTNVKAGNLPRPIRDKCIRPNELTETVNLTAEKNRTVTFWQRKIANNRQIISEQMKATGDILSYLAVELGKAPHSDCHLAALLKEKTATLDCIIEDVRLTGTGGEMVINCYKQPCNANRECLHTILPLIANLTQEKMNLHAECGNSKQGKRCKLTMRVASRYGVKVGMASSSKQPGGVCGDTCRTAPVSQGRVGLILSDGMGSGSKAAGESGAAVGLLERMMAVGFDVDIAVKTVNSMLLLRMPEESFVTIDMAVINTYSGDAEFLKIGAAPSFVKRVREVSVIKSSSLPIGIINQIEIETIKWKLVPGDVIVMVSDGVADVVQKRLDKEEWLANFLRRLPDSQPQDMADKILQQAKDMAGTCVRDDMTVLVAEITEHQD